jgi:hypothetical protein
VGAEEEEEEAEEGEQRDEVDGPLRAAARRLVGLGLRGLLGHPQRDRLHRVAAVAVVVLLLLLRRRREVELPVHLGLLSVELSRLVWGRRRAGQGRVDALTVCGWTSGRGALLNATGKEAAGARFGLVCK